MVKKWITKDWQRLQSVIRNWRVLVFHYKIWVENYGKCLFQRSECKQINRIATVGIFIDTMTLQTLSVKLQQKDFLRNFCIFHLVSSSE